MGDTYKFRQTPALKNCECGRKERVNPEMTETFVSSLGEFSQETSLHGMKRVFDSQSVWKRVIWAAMIVMMLGAAAYQLRKKMLSYMKTPVTLDIAVNYEAYMYFPAVLICNSNLYRISAATDPVWSMHRVIMEVYNDSNVQTIDLAKHPELQNISDGEAFIKASAHQLQDLLLSCQWPNGTQCDHTDFTTVITDYGVCYGINTAKELEQTATVNNPGFGYGLRLLLNTEDYEAMPGPQQTIGIKVLIYNQTDIPLVAEHGFDVAPGFQTSIGLKYQRVSYDRLMLSNKLPMSEGGSCGSVPLQYFSNQTYSRKLCTMDFKYQRAANECGCLSYNMPRTHHWPTCSAFKYFGCMIQALQVSDHLTGEQCPQQCVTMEYQQYISFSELSPIKVDSIVNDADKKRQMERNHERALEARSRNLEPFRTADLTVANDFLAVHDRIFEKEMYPGADLRETFLSQLSNSSCTAHTLLPLINDTTFCDSDLLTRFKLDPAQIFPHLSPLFLQLTDEHGAGLESFRDLLNSTLFTLVSEREAVGKFLVKIDSVKEGGGEREGVLNWVRKELFLENAKSKYRYIVQDLRGVDHFPSVRAELEDYLVSTENISAIKEEGRGQAITEALNETANCTEDLYNMLHNVSQFLTLERIRDVGPAFEESIRVGNYCLSSISNLTQPNLRNRVTLFLRRSVPFSERPSSTDTPGPGNIVLSLRDTVEKFKGRYKQLGEDISTLCDNFDQVRKTLANSETVKLEGKEEFDMTYEAVIGFLDGAYSKAEFAVEILRLMQLVYFPGSVKVHFQMIIDSANEMNKALVKAGEDVEQMIQSFNSTQYSQIMSLFFPEHLTMELNSTVPEVLGAVNVCIPETGRLAVGLGERAELEMEAFLSQFTRLHSHLQAYNLSLNLNSEFYRKNLLGVNVYLRDMSVEILSQEVSYGFFSLLSDVGGTLGLFLGASILTLIEFMEYCFGRVFYSCCGKPAVKKRGSVDLVKENGLVHSVPQIPRTVYSWAENSTDGLPKDTNSSVF